MAKKWFFDGKPEDTLEGVDGFDVVQQRAASSALELTCGNDDPDIMQDLIRLSMLGDPMASLMLGQVYENVHDYSSAIKYYDEGIQSKDPQAMRCYADLLMMGNGVEKNEGQAISLYKEAAAHGDRTSMYVLGQYENFAIEDPYMAAYWYGMSAARGFEAGRSKLRTLCEERRKS
jgi:TPR repeat protein